MRKSGLAETQGVEIAIEEGDLLKLNDAEELVEQVLMNASNWAFVLRMPDDRSST